MRYIMFDMEWNYAPSPECVVVRPVPLKGEIIEIGAVMLDESMAVCDTFKSYVRPKYYKKLQKRISQLTGITREQLDGADGFPRVFARFIEWCGSDAVLFTWGSDDMQMLRDNMSFFKLDEAMLPPHRDLQVIYSYEMSDEYAQVSLHAALENYGIEEELEAHDALNDAIYTARVFGKLDIEKGLAEYESHLPLWMSHKPVEMRQWGFYEDKHQAVHSGRVCAAKCPDCGAQLEPLRWIPGGENRKIAVACCPEHGSVFYRMFLHNMGSRGWWIKKELYHMDDALEKYYSDKFAKFRESGRASRRRSRKETE